MYAGLLHAHNAWRWVVLITFVVVLVRAITARGKPDGIGPKAALPLLITVDVQLLLGLILLAVSPVVKALDGYFAFFHPIVMIVVTVGVHLLHKRIKGTPDAALLLKGTVGLLVLVLLATPWHRALFPGM